jgi:hypothetical protein
MDAMKPHTNQMLVYIAPTLAAVLWFTYMTGGGPYYPPGPQTYRNTIHDARQALLTPRAHRGAYCVTATVFCGCAWYGLLPKRKAKRS